MRGMNLEACSMRSAGLLLMRLVAGGIFVVHGYAKLFGGEARAIHPAARRYLGESFVTEMERGGPRGFAATLERLQVPAALPMALLVGSTEFFGGLALVLGAFTRLAA